jgi:hypothetical protein
MRWNRILVEEDAIVYAGKRRPSCPLSYLASSCPRNR